MRFLSWLRDSVADFFNAYADEAEADAEAERLRAEVEDARAIALLAVAQARRTELELREALSEDPIRRGRLAELVARLEEERARADNLLANYRRIEQAAAGRLVREGSVHLAEEVNERRRELRDDLQRAERISSEEELARMEDEARARAFSLDALEGLDAGAGWSRETEHPAAEAAAAAADDAALLARAQELLKPRQIEE
jgi:hypothetical protein